MFSYCKYKPSLFPYSICYSSLNNSHLESKIMCRLTTNTQHKKFCIIIVEEGKYNYL